MIAVALEDHQILRSVIGLITVDMVDHLAIRKASPQQFLRDQNMLPHIPIASRPMMVGHIYNGIPSVIDGSILECKPPVSISVHRTTPFYAYCVANAFPNPGNVLLLARLRSAGGNFIVSICQGESVPFPFL